LIYSIAKDSPLCSEYSIGYLEVRVRRTGCGGFIVRQGT